MADKKTAGPQQMQAAQPKDEEPYLGYTGVGDAGLEFWGAEDPKYGRKPDKPQKSSRGW